MDGIINVYKERGFTSHDVVAKLRGILKQKKIGHTGTLDPDAEGVLPVCLGNGTRVCELLTDRSKEYRAVLLLGTVTDTQDTSGKVLKELPVNCSQEEVIQVIESFVGEQDQIPPMYSALKVNGKKLYELARAGEVIERKPRRINIERISILEMNLPYVTIDVECSKGTYIRTLCNDIGEKLGCGGCMSTLLRTRVGEFHLENSRKLSEIEEARDQGILEQVIMPVESVFLSYPKAIVEDETLRLVRNGNPLSGSMLKGVPRDGNVRICDPDGKFLAVYGWDNEKNRFSAVKMFLTC